MLSRGHSRMKMNSIKNERETFAGSMSYLFLSYIPSYFSGLEKTLN